MTYDPFSYFGNTEEAHVASRLSDTVYDWRDDASEARKKGQKQRPKLGHKEDHRSRQWKLFGASQGIERPKGILGHDQ